MYGAALQGATIQHILAIVHLTSSTPYTCILVVLWSFPDIDIAAISRIGSLKAQLRLSIGASECTQSKDMA